MSMDRDVEKLPETPLAHSILPHPPPLNATSPTSHRWALLLGILNLVAERYLMPKTTFLVSMSYFMQGPELTPLTLSSVTL